MFVALLGMVALVAANASAPTLNFAGAERLWKASKDRLGYDLYSNKFVAYNNRTHLDEKSRCYQISPESVTLFLVFDGAGTVKAALANESSPKAACFIRSYSGLQLPKPPFAPFVLKLAMK